MGTRALEFGSSRVAQREPPLPAVVAGSADNPAPAHHDRERASECGAIDGKNLTQRALGNIPSQGQGLQKGELRASETQRAESRVVMLGKRARGATETRAQAGKGDCGCFIHITIDAYTSIVIQENGGTHSHAFAESAKRRNVKIPVLAA